MSERPDCTCPTPNRPTGREPEQLEPWTCLTCGGYACEYAEPGRTRCAEAICDCFIAECPDGPRALYPEAFVVGDLSTDWWYSDEALAKQAALERGEGTGTFADIVGLFEPRVPPTDDQRCCRCRLDNREHAGGDGHFCGLHVGRGCEAPDDCGPHVSIPNSGD